jgi:hypothetical protein
VESDFSPAVRCRPVVAARGSDRTPGDLEGDPLVGHKLGDLEIRVDAATARPAHDLAVSGSDTLTAGVGGSNLTLTESES